MEVVEYSIIATWQVLMLLAFTFMILEIFAPSFVFFPIGVGLLISAVIAKWVPQTPEIIWISATIIVVVFLTMRLAARAISRTKEERTAGDRYVGQSVVVVSPVQHLQSGEVKLYGEVWSALSWKSEETFDKDEIAHVHSIRGNKFLLAKDTSDNSSQTHSPS